MNEMNPRMSEFLAQDRIAGLRDEAAASHQIVKRSAEPKPTVERRPGRPRPSLASSSAGCAERSGPEAAIAVRDPALRMIGPMTGRIMSPVVIGRASELAAVDLALETALAGHPDHLLVAGEAGVGKSRLLGELARSAADRGMLVARGSCANLGDEGMPYGAIVEALRGSPETSIRRS